MPISGQLNSVLVFSMMLRLGDALFAEGRDNVHVESVALVAAPIVASGRPGWHGDGHNRAHLATSLPRGILVDCFELVTFVSTLNLRALTTLMLGISVLDLLIVVFSCSWK